MHDLILLLLLVVIIAIVIAQIMQLHNHATKPLLMGIVLGIIGVIGFNKIQKIESKYKKPLADEDNNYNYDLGGTCRNACKMDCTKDTVIDNKEATMASPTPKVDNQIQPKLPNYRDKGIHPYYPTNFDFDQNKFEDMVVPDGWLSEVQDLKVNKNKYDIDGHLINGNTSNPGKSIYTDDMWNMQTDPSTVDAFTAANLHMSRKPREAFYYQSRWGVNSLRPWIAQELDDNANKVWYEDNPDLDQYM